jgi:large subunit ribosomal protein L15
VKLHDLKPAPGSTKRRMRVGRGISAGKGKTAGRGTKGQKSRSGASIPGWFEGGQTPIHVRVPKLRGFKRRGRIEYQVVNIGRIAEYAAAGRFGSDTGSEPLTVNAEVLASAGLISHADRPLKVLGSGDLDVKLFVAADAFTASAKSKIEDAGGFVQSLAPEPEPEPEPEVKVDDASEAGAEAAAPAVETSKVEAEAPAEEAKAKAEDSAEAAPEEPAEAQSSDETATE